MKYSFWIFIVIVFLSSCSTKKKTENRNDNFLQISIDSNFVNKYNVKGLNKIPNIENFKISDNDEIFDFAKTKMEFYEFKSVKLNDNVTVKIIVTAMTPDFFGDGTLKMAYLATFDNSDKQIDVIRIGKIEELSDMREIEFSTIKNSSIFKSNHYLFMEIDNSGKGIGKEKNFNENYTIENDGRILKK